MESHQNGIVLEKEGREESKLLRQPGLRSVREMMNHHGLIKDGQHRFVLEG